ncbi:MAG: arylamine N-acetyltransferase [Verrucomicrobiota bacterium]
MSDLDLKAYFSRIGYKGFSSPTLKTLKSIQQKQARTIPFENLDVLWNRTIDIDLASVQKKLIQKKRGGYCFEQNMILCEVLIALGFSVKMLTARAMYRVPAGVVRPRTHMIMRVSLPEGDYLADAGFGGLSLPEPLKFEMGVEQKTSHGLYRMIEAGDEIEIEAVVGSNWEKLYCIASNEQIFEDYLLQNWYIYAHPQSHFRPNLMVARVANEGRYALQNLNWSFYPLTGSIEKKKLESVQELLEVLKKDFLLELKEERDLKDLETLVKGWL